MCIATVNTRPSLYTRKFDPVIYLFIILTSYFCLIGHLQKYFINVKKLLLVFTFMYIHPLWCRGHLKCDGTRAEARFRLSAKRTSPFKSAGASVQSTTGSRGVCISGSNAGYTMFRGSVKNTGYPLHSPVSPSLPLLCVTTCHHISTGVYNITGLYS
jgi:hypothetical protein